MEKEKKSKPKRKTLLAAILIAVCIMIAAIFSAYYFGILAPYKFSFERSGVMYYSNEYSPIEFFSGFKGIKEVYVSPAFIEGQTDQLVANSMNLWLVVLNSKGQKAIQLLRVYDAPNGNLLNCYTNWGDVNKSEQVSTELCNEILSDANKMKVLIDKGADSRVILSSGKMEVFYASSKDASALNLNVIEQIYPDADEIRKKVNDIIGQIG